MTGNAIKKIKYLLGLVLFSSTIIINLAVASASYTAGEVVTLTNSARSENGLGSLTTNSKLASAAYAKAQDIIEKDYFAHNSPDGKTPWDFINEAGYSYSYAGENLAIGYSNASELFTAWMNSPTHRDNILNSNFREIGIAVVSGDYQGAQTVVAVQEFGAPNGASQAQNEQVASEAKPALENSTPTPSSQTTPTPSSNIGQRSFNFINDKSGITPENVFVGEEITITVTITGEVESLEATVFDQKINLLDTHNISGTTEKTYTKKQKIEKEGTSEIRIVGTDKNGNSDALSFGTIASKPTVITKNEKKETKSLMAGFKDSFTNYWFLYLIAFCVLTLLIIVYKISHKTKFNDLMTSWRL